MVSVIIPAWESPDLIVRAIHSVLVQSFDDFEIIIIGDGQSEKICKKYEAVRVFFRDKRIQYHNLRYHKVLPWRCAGVLARNYGLTLVKGCFIAPLDEDDMWLPYHLEESIEGFNKNPDIDLVYAQFLSVPSDSSKTMVVGEDINKPTCMEKFINKQRNVIGHQTVVYRAKYRDVLYEEHPELPADYRLWLTLFEKGAQFSFQERIHSIYYHNR